MRSRSSRQRRRRTRWAVRLFLFVCLFVFVLLLFLLFSLGVNIFIQIHMCFFLILGYGKTVSHVIIGLKTTKGTKQLKVNLCYTYLKNIFFKQLHTLITFFFFPGQLDPTIYESIQKEKIQVGDVIYIEANSGAVKVSAFFFFFLKKNSIKCFWLLRGF